MVELLHRYRVRTTSAVAGSSQSRRLKGLSTTLDQSVAKKFAIAYDRALMGVPDGVPG